MMSSTQAMEMAVKYEEKGNTKVAEFYLRMALHKEWREEFGNYVDGLQGSMAAIKSANRSVTGSIHK